MVIFYKSLLKVGNLLTPNDKIVYSYLIYKSIPLIDCAFTKDGTELDVESIKDALEFEEWIELKKISYRKLAEELSISPRCVISSLQKLKSLNLLTDNEIKVDNVINDGYFELYKPTKNLKNELLIFYSYIKNKAIYFGGVIDTFKYKLAEDFGTTKVGVTNLLNRLYRLGLAERLPNGKLKVN